mmetsp:Transcript_44341/g.84806  ORF Transcript_44341/g.84806 Transcript_44341/m.84806 type:complete len:159 (+) Transcript_44341:213-689(+)
MLHVHRAALAQIDATRTQYIQESFRSFDENSKGWLSKSELKCAMASLLGVRPSKAEVELVMQQGEAEGKVEFAAFKKAMEEKLGAVDPEEHVRRLFQAFDVRCQGFITRPDLHKIFAEFLSTIPPTVVDEIFEEVDTDQDGRVSYREFCAVMQGSVTL